MIIKAIKRKAIGFWGWLWRGILALVGIGGVTAAVMLGFSAKDNYDQANFDKQPLSVRNLIVFDAVVKAVNTHYYDPTFGGVDWAKASREARPKAAAAKTAYELYAKVLKPLLLQLPTSHAEIISATTHQIGKGPDHTVVNLLTPGFELVPLIRHGRRYMVVGDVFRGSAADAAGIQPGWLVMQVRVTGGKERIGFEGQFIHVIADHAVVKEEAPGDGPDKSFTLQFDPIADMTAYPIIYDMPVFKAAPDFESRRLASGARYIRFDAFKSDGDDSPFMDRVMTEIDKAGPEGVVLDMRHNLGGDKDQCVRFLSHLLPDHTALGTMKDRQVTKKTYTNGWSHRYTGPLVVLIGPSTISAAEITAQNLKYYHRATLIGRISNGSVLWSQNWPLPDGSSIQLPTYDYLGPDGQRIESVGVIPDIEIIPTLADIRAGRDPVLERAESLLAHK